MPKLIHLNVNGIPPLTTFDVGMLAYSQGNLAPGLFGEMEEKQPNEVIAEAFRRRLRDVAGFKYVPQPVPMRNSRSSTVYYLFFAAQKETAQDILVNILDKYRREGAL